jgi:hypothetical protein
MVTREEVNKLSNEEWELLDRLVLNDLIPSIKKASLIQTEAPLWITEQAFNRKEKEQILENLGKLSPSFSNLLLGILRSYEKSKDYSWFKKYVTKLLNAGYVKPTIVIKTTEKKEVKKEGK